MKQNIKRFFALVCMVACLFSLTACSAKNDQAAQEMDPQMSLYICQATEGLLEQITGLTAEEIPEIEGMLQKQKQTGLLSGVTSWVSVQKDTGAFVSVIDSSVQITDDDQYVCTVKAAFQNRNADFKIFFAEGEMSLEPLSITFSPEYTVAENMTKAALNTALGMGTVFAVLIFLSLLIGCFKYISVFEKKMKEKNAPAPAPAPVPAAAPAVVEEEEELVDDLELVAVITAAICAATNSSSDGLVVRSIKRAPSAKWKRA